MLKPGVWDSIKLCYVLSRMSEATLCLAQHHMHSNSIFKSVSRRLSRTQTPRLSSLVYGNTCSFFTGKCCKWQLPRRSMPASSEKLTHQGPGQPNPEGLTSPEKGYIQRTVSEPCRIRLICAIPHSRKPNPCVAIDLSHLADDQATRNDDR